jgi:hypothetical protein
MAKSSKFQNNTSRLRKYVCACQFHAVTLSDDPDNAPPMRSGPYIIRAAGDALLVRCEACGELFKLSDEAATRSRVYRGCTHCTNPEAHTHEEPTATIQTHTGIAHTARIRSKNHG